MIGDYLIDLTRAVAPYAKWVFIVFLIVHVFCLFDKKRNAKIPDMRTRMVRKFNYVNAELFPHLDSHQKKEMLDVLKTTLNNAELFNAKENRTSSIESARKKSSKKVRFNSNMVSDTFVY